jgi:hypothetical protein
LQLKVRPQRLNDFFDVNIVVRLSLATEPVFTFFSRDDEGPEILAEEISFYENEHMMGFKLTNTGLQMILDIEVRIR